MVSAHHKEAGAYFLVDIRVPLNLERNVLHLQLVLQLRIKSSRVLRLLVLYVQFLLLHVRERVKHLLYLLEDLSVSGLVQIAEVYVVFVHRLEDLHVDFSKLFSLLAEFLELFLTFLSKRLLLLSGLDQVLLDNGLV